MSSKRKNNRILGYIVLAILPFPIIFGYFWLKDNIYKALDYCYKIRGIRINEISQGKISLDLFLIFKNLSIFKYKIKNIKGKLYIEKEYIVDFEVKSEYYIEPKKQKDIVLNIVADFSGIKLDIEKINTILKIVNKFMSDKNNLLFTFDLKIEIELFRNTIYVPLIIEYTFKELTENKPTNCKIE